MPYDLKQIFAALGTVENGGAMVADLQTQMNTLKTAAESSSATNRTILQQLGIDDAGKVPAIKETLDAIKASGQAPDTVGTQLYALSQQIKDLTAKYTASEEKAAAERTKRIQTAITSQVVSALTEGKALKPDTFADLLAKNVSAKEDDSLIYKSGDKEMSIADGVKSWLAENTWAVKNDSNPGAGSGAPNGGSAKKYTMDDIAKMSREEINDHWNEISKGVNK